jgi:hypothetical protein
VVQEPVGVLVVLRLVLIVARCVRRLLDGQLLEYREPLLLCIVSRAMRNFSMSFMPGSSVSSSSRVASVRPTASAAAFARMLAIRLPAASM